MRLTQPPLYFVRAKVDRALRSSMVIFTRRSRIFFGNALFWDYSSQLSDCTLPFANFNKKREK